MLVGVLMRSMVPTSSVDMLTYSHETTADHRRQRHRSPVSGTKVSTLSRNLALQLHGFRSVACLRLLADLHLRQVGLMGPVDPRVATRPEPRRRPQLHARRPPGRRDRAGRDLSRGRSGQPDRGMSAHREVPSPVRSFLPTRPGRCPGRPAPATGPSAQRAAAMR